jgi:UDP-glucuronate decarboxylase
MDYHRQRGVEIRIARIFNTYGPRMAENDGRVVSNFIVQALNNEPITIYGDGTQTRCFQYIDDLIEGLLIVMNSGINAPINIGNPIEYTILELAKSIIDMIMSKSDIVFKDLPVDDPQRRQPDTETARMLGWKPRVDLMSGLRETIKYFKGDTYIKIDNPFK